uniref:EGF-like domain-containing protein n=1 Tax=Tetradesmus obliquus TaxID=3088 RepID=A0A383WA81_TETOB|eukprot:jgi/Sobl393_1/16881/SZX74102.1
MLNSSGTCIDVSAPGTGYTCGCLPGFGWDGAACAACASVVAGNGGTQFNGDNILATAASLTKPRGVAVDAAGNICIADTDNFRVRRVSKATGIINTIAESVRPYDVLAGSDGNVYFGDFGGTLFTYNTATATVTPRQLTSLADGSTQLLDAQLVGLSINPVNELLYAAYENDPTDTTAAFGGTIFSVNLSSNDPAVRATRFPAGDLNSAQYIVFNGAGEAFITTAGNRIYKWSGSGSPAPWNTGSSTPQQGAAATSVRFGLAWGIAIDAAGNMLIGETDKCRVWLVDASTGTLKLVAGNLGEASFSPFVEYNREVDDDVLPVLLRELTALTELDVRYTGVSEAGRQYLQQLTRLQQLQL